MQPKRLNIKISSTFILLIFILVSASPGFNVAAAPDTPANGGIIRGQVTSPGGYPLPFGTMVKLFEPGTETIRGMAQPDRFTGLFQIGPVPNGMYVLKAVPTFESGYTQSLPVAVSIVNNPVNIGEIALTLPQITGTVFAPDGITPASAEVLVFAGDHNIIQRTLALRGHIRIGGLPVGSYALVAFPIGGVPYWHSRPAVVSIPSPTSVQTVNLTLTKADLWGIIQDSLGNPVPGARITATKDSGEQAGDLSNEHGFWAIGGLVDGVYQLTATPPWENSGLLPPPPLEVTLPGANNPYTLVFGTPVKQVVGTVLTNTGTPVFHALVVAHRVNQPGAGKALSDASGAYQLDLAPGLWALTVKKVDDTSPSDWVFPDAPLLVYFQANNDPETRTQDFTVLTADVSVSGVVAMPDGSTPPFTVTVGFYSDEGVGVKLHIDPADGSFSARLPNGGYKVVIHPEDRGYVGPVVDPITLAPNGSLDMGTLTLLPRDAVVSGAITSGGNGVADIPIIAWRRGAPGSLRTVSGPDGLYSLAVSQGTWHIQPAPAPDQPYLYTGSGETLEFTPGQHIENIDFELLAADATILGRLVNEAGDPLTDAEGWASAFQIGAPEIHNGAPIQAGHFTILVPAGSYRVAAFFPAGSPYISTGERQVTVGSGETVELTLTVKIKNAAIAGALWDPRNEDIVEGVAGIVGAWSEGSWTAAPINTDNGTYRMGVAAGLWHLNFRIDPRSGYVKISGPVNVPVMAHQTAVVPLKVLPRDGRIEGLVLAPDGTPLAGAAVHAKGVGPLLDHLWLHTRSAEDGSFSLVVPHGQYRLGASYPNQDWIVPIEKLVEVPPGGVSGGHTLQFRLPDATISGTLTVSNTVSAGEVVVWAWAEDGAFTRGVFPVSLGGDHASGPYSLGVTSGTTWHLGAVYETERAYWFGRAEVIVSGPGEIAQDILLNGPHPKPAPAVVTFDASQPMHINLGDGAHIFIPAGAMPAEGLVTLRIVPIATLPHQGHANVLKYGYAFYATAENGEPIEAHFNLDVVITFLYDDAELARQHILEGSLKPAYFSTTTNRWTFPESFVVDTVANRIIMMIDHFTDYAITGQVGYQVFMPLTMR